MGPKLSRDAQLVKFFAQQYQGVPRKHLVKLLYMTDLLAREYLGEPISSFVWYRHKHGPYDRNVESAIQELVVADLVRDVRDPWWRGHYQRLIDLHEPIPFEFSIGQLAVLEYVSANYVNMPTKEFVEQVVYETKPFKATHRNGQRLPMDAVNHAGTRRVGFRLEDVLQAEHEARKGDFKYLTEFVNELRAKAPA